MRPLAVGWIWTNDPSVAVELDTGLSGLSGLVPGRGDLVYLAVLLWRLSRGLA